MSTTQLLIDTADRIFTDFCDKAALDAAEAGEFPAALWAVIQEHGLHELALVDGGLSLSDVFAVLQVAGRYAVPLPLAEILLANRWLGSSDTLYTIGIRREDEVIDLPWGRASEGVLVLDYGIGRTDNLARVTGKLATTGHNLAGEARDVYRIGSLQALPAAEDTFVMLALARTVQMAGTLTRVLELSLQYAGEREQFGRPIARFQAIQHTLAVMAAETAAALKAADAAVAALDAVASATAEASAEQTTASRVALEVAAAKARVGEACGLVAEQAHQVHGAMGYTHEHQLHHFTRRLWAWRDEYGTESYWQQHLGRHLAGLGADSLWDYLATRG